MLVTPYRLRPPRLRYLLPGLLALSILTGITYAAGHAVNITDTLNLTATNCVQTSGECIRFIENFALCTQTQSLYICNGASGSGGGITGCGPSGCQVADAFHFTESSVLTLGKGVLRVVSDAFLFAEVGTGAIGKGLVLVANDVFHLAEPVTLWLGSVVTTITGSIQTVYSTVSTLGNGSSEQFLGPLLILFLVLMTPAGIIGLVTRSYWGVAIGAVLGAALASLPQVNILPFWALVPIILGVLVMIVASETRGNGV